MNRSMKKILIIIPAYNEEKSILKTVERIKDQYDYVVINDCSTDNTKQVLEENNLNYIDLPANLGIGGGVQTGYKYAYRNGYDIAIQFDGDGQHNEEYIPDLVKPIEDDDADIVVGSRYIKKEGFQSSAMRQLGIRFFEKLIKGLSGQPVTDATSGFRAVNRKIMEEFVYDYPQDYPEPQTNLAVIKRGFRLKEVPVIMNAREEGTSSITPAKSVYFMIKVSMAILFENFKEQKK